MQRLIAPAMDVSSQMPNHAPAAFVFANSGVYEEGAVHCRMALQEWTSVLLLCILASAPACSSLTSGKRDLLQSKAWIACCPPGILESQHRSTRRVATFRSKHLRASASACLQAVFCLFTQAG